MVTESELFVWEVFRDPSQGRLSPDIRDQMRRCLTRAEAPLRWAVLVSSLFAYALPLLVFQDSLLEALAAQNVERAWLAVAVLFGVSTLVLSPLFGLLAQSRRESGALMLDGRKFTPTTLRPGPGAGTQLSITTVDGPREVIVTDSLGRSLPQDCVVYALPEEVNLAVVQWNGARGMQFAKGHLQAGVGHRWA